MAKEPKWSLDELKVVDRYVAAVRTGRYDFLLYAARDCQRELAGLNTPRRTSGAVFQRLEARAKAAGLRAYHAPWTRQERRVLRRFADAIVAHRYLGVEKAAAECSAELRRLRRTSPGAYAPHGINGIRDTLAGMARASGWSVTGSRLTAEENRLLDRYVKAVESGRFPGTLAAARACLEDFERLRASQPCIFPKTLATIRSYIWRRWRERNGLQVRQWSSEEDEVIDRYVKAVMAGRYENAAQAAADCQREIARLSPAGANRTRRAIEKRICQRAARLGQPRPFIDWTDEEKAILERHARGVISGEHANASAATRACLRELQGYFRRLRTTSHVRSIAGRSQKALLGKMHQRVRELGRCGPPNRRWSADEKRFLAQWMRWYDRYRGVRRLRPLTEAALGLQADVERLGSTRTTHACKAQLQIERMRLLGFA